jgi:hypothetical protein
VKIEVEVGGVVTPSSVVIGHRRFGGPSCLHLQDAPTLNCVTIQKTSTLKEAAYFSEHLLPLEFSVPMLSGSHLRSCHIHHVSIDGRKMNGTKVGLCLVA